MVYASAPRGPLLSCFSFYVQNSNNSVSVGDRIKEEGISASRNYFPKFPENKAKIPIKFPTENEFPIMGGKVSFIAFLLTNILVLAATSPNYEIVDKF